MKVLTTLATKPKIKLRYKTADYGVCNYMLHSNLRPKPIGVASEPMFFSCIYGKFLKSSTFCVTNYRNAYCLPAKKIYESSEIYCGQSNVRNSNEITDGSTNTNFKKDLADPYSPLNVPVYINVASKNQSLYGVNILKEDNEIIAKMEPLICFTQPSISRASNNDSNTSEALGLQMKSISLSSLNASQHISSLSMLCSSPPTEISPEGKDNLEKPTPKENSLTNAYNLLSKELPSFFKKSMSYGNVYNPRIIFENKIRGTRTEGIGPYIYQLSALRLVGHLKYAYVQMKILKITQHPEDNTIKVRWRIIGVSSLQSFFLIFKLLKSSMKETKEEKNVWHDGFSIFYLGEDGLIFKHVADKMMPDEGISLRPSLTTRIFSWLSLGTKPAVTNTVADLGKDKMIQLKLMEGACLEKGVVGNSI